MALKQYNPTSPGRRQLVGINRSELWKGGPVKKLTEGLSKSGGRNNNGRITSFARGGGHKRSYRIVDFKRTKFDVQGTVERLEYDPNRTAFIALVTYDDGEQAYILAPQRLAAGDKVISSMNAVDVKPGNTMPLERMPVGTIVHNIELKPKKGGQMARSAGAYAQYVGRDAGWAILRMGSGEQRLVHGSCLATVGSVSNQDHSNTSIGKAGHVPAPVYAAGHRVAAFRDNLGERLAHRALVTDYSDQRQCGPPLCGNGSVSSTSRAPARVKWWLSK
jgi:large subunit ribosomal protein L2